MSERLSDSSYKRGDEQIFASPRFGQRAPKYFKSFTTFSCLDSMAADNGVLADSSALLTSAPAWRSNATQASCPLRAAWRSGVPPSDLGTFTSAPAFMRSMTTGVRP